MSEIPVPVSDDYKAMTFNIRDKEPDTDTGYHHVGGKTGAAIIEPWHNTEARLDDDYARIGQGEDGLTIGKFNAIYYNKNRFEVLEKGNR